MAANSTNLIIVESPAKARTLKRYLGDNYQIEASVGHIRDLPKSDLGVDVDNGFKPTYVASEDKSKVISQLKKMIKITYFYVINRKFQGKNAIFRQFFF